MISSKFLGQYLFYIVQNFVAGSNQEIISSAYIFLRGDFRGIAFHFWVLREEGRAYREITTI